MSAEVIPIGGRCERHGPYTGQPIRGFSGRLRVICPGCEAERQDRAMLTEAAEREERFRRGLAASGIEALFAGATLDGYRMTHPGQVQAVSVCRGYASSPERCLILVGTTGTGKTHLASAILLQRMRRGDAVRYTTAASAVQTVQDVYRSKDRTVREAVERYSRPDLLCLDELGMQVETDSAARILTQILDERYAAQRPTILISNRGLDEVAASIGDRAWSRVQEGAVTLVCVWPDYRRTMVK
ncbi:MAG: ATP-binding protein [Magnetococcales bacterium]|nr:ATP-binding protein [Magnetococcales bacterium]